MTDSILKRFHFSTGVLLVLAGSAFAEQNSIALTFREEVLVRDTVFSVGNLAQVEGANAALIATIQSTVAGQSAPPGYSRFLSTADFSALRLRNAFPEVAFSLHGASRTTIRTDYRTVSVADCEKSIRSYVDSAVGWKPDEWRMEITNPLDSCKCLNTSYAVTASGLRNPFPKGNTNLTLEISQGSKNSRLTVACIFSVTCRVVAAKNEISRGTPISTDDLEIRTMDCTRFAPVPFTDYNDLAGKKAARTIKAGSILHQRMVLNVPVIEKGEPVSIVFSKGRFSIAVAGIAREKGDKGERIWVENSATHKLIRVIVREKGKVHVLQGGAAI